MARIARVVAAGMPHHITQRGNRRQQTFFSDDDWRKFLSGEMSTEEVEDIRKHGRTGRPLGSVSFVEKLEGQWAVS